jgi:hypothetical protein
MTRVSRFFVVPAFTLLATSLPAQSISIGLRGTGSFPTGAFAQTPTSTTTPPSSDVLIEGAKNGFGYGLDAFIGVGPIGVYAGFDQIKFDCETTTCTSTGKYTLQGATAGVKIYTPMISVFRPYVKGGITFNNLQGGYGGQSSNVLTTDRTPGYEIGLGFDYSLLGIFSLCPQARYVGQNFKGHIPGVTTPATANGTGVNYITFDVGFAVHTPFGGKH